MQTGSAQCIQALAIITLPLVGPCRRKRGLLLCVEAQARTQSSQRVQRSRSMTIVAVPLKKRLSVRNSSISEPIFAAAFFGGVGAASIVSAGVISGGSLSFGIAGSTTFSMIVVGIMITWA